MCVGEIIFCRPGRIPIFVIEILPTHYESRMNSRIITIEKQVPLFGKTACDLRVEVADLCGIPPRGDARFEEADSGRRISYLLSPSKPEVK
jgi:hypothetical protein